MSQHRQQSASKVLKKSTACPWLSHTPQQANVAESAFTCRRKHIPPMEGWPRFLLCFNKEPGVVKLWFRTGVHSEASSGRAGSCSHPRKIQWEKKFMEASRSLFNSVWGLSESWVNVYKGAIKHRLGIISVGCLPVTGPQVRLRGSFSAGQTIAEGEQTIQRSLSFCMVLSLALNKTGVPPFCLVVRTIFRSQWYFSTLFHYISTGSQGHEVQYIKKRIITLLECRKRPNEQSSQACRTRIDESFLEDSRRNSLVYI